MAGDQHVFLRRLILESAAPTVASCAREMAAQGSAPLFGFSKAFHEFIAAALVKDPAKRASATQLLNHTWIKKNASSKLAPLPPDHAILTAAASHAPSSSFVPPLSPTGATVGPFSPLSASAASGASSPPPSSSSSSSSFAPATQVHKLIYSTLVDPWLRLQRERRVREERERKEAERLARKNRAAAARHVAIEHDALRQGQGT
jgi:serine/threonine protein kinase